MFLCSWYKLILYYTTYIVININTFIKAKKTKKNHRKSNNPLKSIIVTRLAEQHLI